MCCAFLLAAHATTEEIAKAHPLAASGLQATEHHGQTKTEAINLCRSQKPQQKKRYDDHI